MVRKKRPEILEQVENAMNGLGDRMIPAVLTSDLVVLLVEGCKTAFRVSDRLLVCPSCGNLSRPPSNVCYGCEENQALPDPLEGPASHLQS